MRGQTVGGTKPRSWPFWSFWFPEWAPWLADFEAELLHFTAGDSHAHDDQVDVLAYAAREMATHTGRRTGRPSATGGRF